MNLLKEYFYFYIFGIPPEKKFYNIGHRSRQKSHFFLWVLERLRRHVIDVVLTKVGTYESSYFARANVKPDLFRPTSSRLKIKRQIWNRLLLNRT